MCSASSGARQAGRLAAQTGQDQVVNRTTTQPVRSIKGPAGRHISSLTHVLCPASAVPQQIHPTYRFGVTVLLKLDVRPHYAQVALVDATWQDHPQWETGDEQVVFGTESLTDPHNPPYPSFAVATQPDIGRDGPRTVRVEVWSDGEPPGLRCVHQSVLHVGSHGVLVGNDQSGSMTELALARG